MKIHQRLLLETLLPTFNRLLPKQRKIFLNFISEQVRTSKKYSCFLITEIQLCILSFPKHLFHALLPHLVPNLVLSKV